MFWSERTRIAADILLAALVVTQIWLAFTVFAVRDLIYVNRAMMQDVQSKEDVVLDRLKMCKP